MSKIPKEAKELWNPTLDGFATWLVHEGHITEIHSLLYFLSKPWKWQEEYEMYLEEVERAARAITGKRRRK